PGHRGEAGARAPSHDQLPWRPGKHLLRPGQRPSRQGPAHPGPGGTPEGTGNPGATGPGARRHDAAGRGPGPELPRASPAERFRPGSYGVVFQAAPDAGGGAAEGAPRLSGPWRPPGRLGGAGAGAGPAWPQGGGPGGSYQGRGDGGGREPSERPGPTLT